jgi:hypothetical protein
MAEITTRGPFFDSRRTRFTNEFCEDLAREVAETAEQHWITGMRRTFKEPTPIYWNTTKIENKGKVVAVNDGGRSGGLVYGPWLEGVGSRNKTTRFKGYFNLRKAAQKTRGEVRKLAAGLLPFYYRKMNGV